MASGFRFEGIIYREKPQPSGAKAQPGQDRSTIWLATVQGPFFFYDSRLHPLLSPWAPGFVGGEPAWHAPVGKGRGALQAQHPPHSDYSLYYGSVQPSADCNAGMINGEEPKTVSQAELLNAACQVAFGST